MEYTLALIKPDAVKAGKAAEMMQLMQLHDFSIIAKKQLQVCKAVSCCCMLTTCVGTLRHLQGVLA